MSVFDGAIKSAVGELGPLEKVAVADLRKALDGATITATMAGPLGLTTGPITFTIHIPED